MITKIEQLSKDELSILSTYIKSAVEADKHTQTALVPLINIPRVEYLSMAKDPVNISKKCPRNYVEQIRHFFDINLDDIFVGTYEEDVRKEAAKLRAKANKNRRKMPGRGKPPKLESKKMTPTKAQQDKHTPEDKKDVVVPDHPGNGHAEAIANSLEKHDKLNGDHTAAGILNMARAQDKKTAEEISLDEIVKKAIEQGNITLSEGIGKLIPDDHVESDDMVIKNISDGIDEMLEGLCTPDAAFVIEHNVETKHTYIIAFDDKKFEYCYKDGHLSWGNGDRTITIATDIIHIKALFSMLENILIEHESHK